MTESIGGVPRTTEERTENAWWLCPLSQCTHGRVLHDGDGENEPFTCCVDDCECGKCR